eukprot:2543542-Rhodomonas_salina.1
MVPAFHVQELRDKPTDKWWQSPPVDFHNCTILQMDIAGFTYLRCPRRAPPLFFAPACCSSRAEAGQSPRSASLLSQRLFAALSGESGA